VYLCIFVVSVESFAKHHLRKCCDQYVIGIGTGIAKILNTLYKSLSLSLREFVDEVS
jgi:hypothetical protein